MEEKEKIVISKDGENVEVFINPKIYPLPVIFGAAYSFMDKAYAVIDKDQNNVVITLWPKKKQDLKETAMLFSQELLNYAVCFSQSKKTEEVRLALAKRAFLAHSGTASCNNELFVNDPLGIASPWQKK